MIYNYTRSCDKVIYRGFITKSQFELLEYAIMYKSMQLGVEYTPNLATDNRRGFEHLLHYKSKQVSREGGRPYYHDISLGYRYTFISKQTTSYTYARHRAKEDGKQFKPGKGQRKPLEVTDTKYQTLEVDEIREAEIIYNPNKGKFYNYDGSPTLLGWSILFLTTMTRLNGDQFKPFIRKWDIADDYEGDVEGLVVGGSRKQNGIIYYGFDGDIETIYDGERGQGTRFYNVPECRVSEASNALSSNHSHYLAIQDLINKYRSEGDAKSAEHLAKTFKPPYPNSPIPRTTIELQEIAEKVATEWYEHHIIRKEQTFEGKIFLGDNPNVQYKDAKPSLPPTCYGFYKSRTPIDILRFIKSLGGMKRADICALFLIMVCGWQEYLDMGNLNEDIKRRMTRYLSLLTERVGGVRVMKLSSERERKLDLQASEKVILTHAKSLNTMIQSKPIAQVTAELNHLFTKLVEMHTPTEKEEIKVELDIDRSAPNLSINKQIRDQEKREKSYKQSTEYLRLKQRAEEEFYSEYPKFKGRELVGREYRFMTETVEELIERYKSESVFEGLDDETYIPPFAQRGSDL